MTRKRWTASLQGPWGAGVLHTVSPLGLLSIPLAFSQNRLLDPDEFSDAARVRGVTLRVEQLIELHRRRILVPFFQVLSRPHRAPRRTRVPNAADASRLAGSHMAAVVRASRECRLIDPAGRRFNPWHPNQWRHRLEPPRVFYSPHQLLGVKVYERACREMSVSHASSDILSYSLGRLQPEAIRDLDGGRQLAILLSGLDIRYWPTIFGTVHWPDDWYASISSFDVRKRLARFRTSAKRVAEAAECLLARAALIDQLGNWHDVVGLAHPETWRTLKRTARLAMDYRVAAEVLLRALDDLGRTDLSTPPPRIPRRGPMILDQRLPKARDALEGELMKRGLSPFPSLLLVLEGPTEMLLMPKVIEELLGRPAPSSLIECVPLNTIDQSLDMFVRHSVALRIGESRGDYVMLDRPATKILVAVDPERDYESARKVEQQRRKFVTWVHSSLPSEVRSRVTATDLDSLVTVRTWGSTCWEFANFTDTDLARAIARRWVLPPGVTWRTIRNRVAALRRRYKTPDIEVVATCWHVRVKKVPLAHELEDALMTRVQQRRERGTLHRLPAARIADEAIRLALSTHRRTVALPLR